VLFEAGGMDGERWSKSWYWEKLHNWNILLVEANHRMFEKLIEKRRKVFSLELALSSSRVVEEVK